ncbi:MAG: hypothetical protein A2X28_02575 [Elusimicrobia bacterium GWA2_56_46]|nr:MAG: hypothetical protein A2X28_02575 [Elusimicrobia bacterium GWA2_56_46]OGR55354.1 MAG: hypothetical protein A2X39_00390 [Elusimicrobia bacterium GWC2_56_31]HBB66030.1 hypothetical protein [Elusimicrobiota bacterium]HBW23685.1 hypothetical protein [Elusimicrobiota bacterium]
MRIFEMDNNGGPLFQDRLVLYRYFNYRPAYFEVPRISEIKEYIATDTERKVEVHFASPDATLFSVRNTLQYRKAG